MLKSTDTGISHFNDKLEQSSEKNLTMIFLRQKAQNNGARFNIKGSKLLFIKTIFLLLVNHHFL